MSFRSKSFRISCESIIRALQKEVVSQNVGESLAEWGRKTEPTSAKGNCYLLCNTIPKEVQRHIFKTDASL